MSGTARGGTPEALERLIGAFVRMPGIGRRSAERLAYHVVQASAEEVRELEEAVRSVRQRVVPCSICCALTEIDPCPICRDERRDAGLVMVVEQPKDLAAIEATGFFRGTYHVLAGAIDPLAGVGPETLTIARLLARIDDPASNARGVPVRELVLALNPTLEGDGTALHLADMLSGRPVQVTRLARGLPSGASIDFQSPAVLADAIAARQAMEDGSGTR